jgi:hypothetical protein
MTTNRRRMRRRAFAHKALVCSPEGKPLLDCHLRDVSDGGARLAVAPADLAKLPAEFILVLTSGARVRRECRVVWRSQNEAGIRFQ